MIEQSSIETLKNSLDIIDVVSSRIELKKNGANFKACCPFHDEKSPSFVVSPSKQIYHCFGCTKGGDSIKFVMEYENLGYVEALEELASEYNITLTYSNEKANIDNKKKEGILSSLNNYFVSQLHSNPDAMNYLKSRGIKTRSIEKFEIGYAPESSKTMQFYKDNFYQMNDLEELGVVSSENEVYARFIKRITFPILSPSSRIVGFGGRTITDHPAKYINSPQSKVFNKSRLLYGYNLASKNIYRRNKIIITEGYLDVVMLHQVGFDHAVATLGTALTNDHIPLIKKSNAFVVLAYDGDDAGINAAFKASSLLSSHGINGGVVLFGDGKDPADMVREDKLNELQSLFDNSTALVKFVLETIVSKFDINNPTLKESAFVEAMKYLRTLSPILQDEYKPYVASILKVDIRLIKTNSATKVNFNTQTTKEDIAELSLIKTLLLNSNLIDYTLDIIDSDFFTFHKNEFELILSNELSGLNSILIRDDIKELDENMFKSQLYILVLKSYNTKLQRLSRDSSLSLKEKSFEIKKLKSKIFNLQNKRLN
ncbi:MAG: DNA primase (EC [uncultured Campylobacterales bacterium]|uniref:DNA primase n=1 Tax=uncultured Campylobacterales bacterium TaxID=352960 RepID=A0A6S6TFW8_9BACT|nr:MAG: DNA primase (EC [uncultured Campylobacterales bacterium]